MPDAPAPLLGTWRRKLLLALFLLFAVLIVAPFLLDVEDTEVADARGEAPGATVELSDGTTHYESVGSGPPVVLVHGFNGPMTTWDHSVEPLSEAGFRVIRYDMLGRGFSDRPDVDYTLDLFVRQLDDLLSELDVDGPVSLVGSSFGCVVSTEYALQNPDRVEKLVLIGPAGFPGPNRAMASFIQLPVISDHIYRGVADRMMRRLTRKYYVEPEKFPQAHADFQSQQRIYGFKRAALSTMRHSPLLDYEPGWKALGQSDIPVLLVWGREDVSFPFDNHEAALEWIPQADFVPIEDAAHLPAYETPKKVHPALIDHLTGNP